MKAVEAPPRCVCGGGGGGHFTMQHVLIKIGELQIDDP